MSFKSFFSFVFNPASSSKLEGPAIEDSRSVAIRYGTGSLLRGALLAQEEYDRTGGRVNRKGYVTQEDMDAWRVEMLKPKTYRFMG